jgi:hypothetical protein
MIVLATFNEIAARVTFPRAVGTLGLAAPSGAVAGLVVTPPWALRRLFLPARVTLLRAAQRPAWLSPIPCWASRRRG